MGISWGQSIAWGKRRHGTSESSTGRAISAIREGRLLRRQAATRTSYLHTILIWMKSRRYAPPGSFFGIAGRNRMARFRERRRRREQMRPIETRFEYMRRGRTE